MQITSILPLILSAAFLLFGHGLIGVLIPLRSQIEGFSPTAIAAIGAAHAIGFTLGCFLTPFFVRKVGHIRTFGALASFLSVLVLFQSISLHPLSWFVARAVMGFCIAGTFMVLESWLNERTTNSNRGSVFSLYMVVSQVALLAGLMTLPLADTASMTLFLFVAMAFSIAVLPTALTGVQSPAPLTRVDIDFRSLYQRSQIAVIGSFLAGIIAGAWTTFAPIFGSNMGLSTTDISIMMAVAMAGGIVFQYPIGRLSDFIDRRIVMVICGIVGAIIGSLLFRVGASGTYDITFWILIFLFGSVFLTIYSLFVAHANDYADASSFVEISSGLLIFYGLGTVIGPLAAAALLEAVGTGGMFAVTTSGHLLIAVFAAYRLLRSSAPEDLDRTDFQPILARTNTPQTYEFDTRSDEEPTE